MSNIFDLNIDMQRLAIRIEEVETEEELKELLELKAETEEELKGKLIDYAYFIKNIEADIEALKNMIEKLKQKKIKKENHKTILRNIMMCSMKENEIKKANDSIISIIYTKGKDKIDITEEEKIPEEFLKKEIKIDKKAINDWFRSTGEVIEGCCVISNEFITIK